MRWLPLVVRLGTHAWRGVGWEAKLSLGVWLLGLFGAAGRKEGGGVRDGDGRGERRERVALRSGQPEGRAGENMLGNDRIN